MNTNINTQDQEEFNGLSKKRSRPLLNNYNVIPDDKRFNLIDMVLVKKMRVKDAAQILNINY
jgi:hypothetical protein